MAPKQAPKPEFQEGERVLCFHGPLLYEAKCLKVATEDKQVRYLIHYSGWNKNWDEWVSESRVLKYSEANLQKQLELQRANQEHQAEGRARGGGPGRRGGGGAAALQQQKHVERLFQNIRITPSTSTTAGASASSPAAATAVGPAASTSPSGPPTGAAAAAAPAEAPGPGLGRKTRKSKQKTGGGEGGGAGSSTSGPRDAPQQRRRGRGDPASKSQAAAPTRAELRVQIPADLKPLLVRDWELVTKQGRLFALPAAKSVDAILDEYVAFQRAQGRRDSMEYGAEEVVGGIRAYFNALLGTQLLYEAERPQHGRVLAAHPDAPMSQLYGGPHLLRLFVRIGAMLAYTAFDDRSLALIFSHLHDFLSFLARDPVAFFDVAEYKEAAAEPSLQKAA